MFCVASSYAGVALSAGVLCAAAPRDLDLAGLAVTTFEEGCVCETIAAMEAAALIPRATEPTIRRVLEQIRDDEARHAELAWATLGWATRTGGHAVYEAIRDAAQQLAPRDTTFASAAIDQLLAEHGVMSEGDHDALTAHAWADVIRPLLVRLGDSTFGVVGGLTPSSPKHV